MPRSLLVVAVACVGSSCVLPMATAAPQSATTAGATAAAV